MAKKKEKKKEEKIESLNAVVSYDGEGELLSDISSSKPLKSTKKRKTIKKTKTKKKQDKKITEKIITDKKITENTDKDFYNKILVSGEYFYLKVGNTIIYDTVKNRDNIIVFQSDHVVIDGNIFSYKGLKLKFKK